MKITTIQGLMEEHPPEPDEDQELWLSRIQLEGHVHWLTKAKASDLTEYRRVKAEAERDNVPVLIHDTPPDQEPDDTPAVRISRAEASNAQAYRAAKAKARQAGLPLKITD
jgi:hypothetical protein